MLLTSQDFPVIATTCQNSSVGKLLPNALYIHRSALSSLAPIVQAYERQARVIDDIQHATLIKFSTERAKISYLFYPDFDTHPHPALVLSIVVDVESAQVNYWDYGDSDNPPILHRKDAFVTPDYPEYEQFEHLTQLEAALGLLDNSRFIGTRLEWEARLKRYRLAFEGHSLVCLLPLECSDTLPIAIERHKAAIVRKSLSRPVRLAWEAELFEPDTSFFDYGCGYGGDIERIAEKGFAALGWDPYYHADAVKISADIVNLGYIINVVEDLAERREALVQAWELTCRVLIVAAQVLIDDRDRGIVAYGDGIITRRNTFQKYYEQEELKTYIEQVLGVEAMAAGLGIYFVFRQENQAQAFRASRYRSRLSSPKIQVSLRRFEDYAELLQPLMQFVTERGRLPIKDELKNEAELKQELRTFNRAFELILQVSDRQDWDKITEKRRDDLLLYLALSRFSQRPTSRHLSPTVRQDIKTLFGSYQYACLLADNLLYRLQELKTIAQVCQDSPVGKRLKNSLLVHVSALATLAPLLRLYEGCASRVIGRMEDANVIQLSWRHPKISYLYYRDFDTQPHPSLETKMEVYLGDIRVKYHDFTADDNPPILHEKEALVAPDYPHYDKFAKLTQQEKAWGLLDNYPAIAQRSGWLQCLEEHCAQLQGHRLQWRKDADPYTIKLLKSRIQAKKNE